MMVKDHGQKTNFIGKYACIKPEVEIPKDHFYKTHGYNYKIIGESENYCTWILLESQTHSSFWMPIFECNIVDNPFK